MNTFGRGFKPCRNWLRSRAAETGDDGGSCFVAAKA